MNQKTESRIKSEQTIIQEVYELEQKSIRVKLNSPRYWEILAQIHALEWVLYKVDRLE